MTYTLVLTYKDVDLKSNNLVGTMICPNCGREIGIVGDQLRGEVSTVCPYFCGFHCYIREHREWTLYRHVVRYEQV